MYIFHTKLIKPTKKYLKKYIDNEEDFYYSVKQLKLSKTGRQIIKRYPDFIVTIDSFKSFNLSKQLEKTIKSKIGKGLIFIEYIKEDIPVADFLIKMWDFHKDFKDYSKPLIKEFQTREMKYIHTDEQLKAIQSHAPKGSQHYINKLKKLPKNSLIEIWY